MGADRPPVEGSARRRLLPACAIAAFVALDQAVKLAVAKPLIGIAFPIFEGLLHFYPKVNENLTWGGNFIEPLSLPAVAIGLNVLVIGLCLSGFAFYRVSVRTPRPVPVATFCLGMAGCLCGLIDRTIWGGSLDYVQVPGLFIFDLKDCYLTASLVLFVVLGLRHQDGISVRAYARYVVDRVMAFAAHVRP